MTATALAATIALTDPATTSAPVVVAKASADNTNGNTFVNDPADVVLVAENTSGGAQTVTFTTQHPGKDGTLVDPVAGTYVVSIPAGDSVVIGPFDPTTFGAPTVADGTEDTQGGADSKLVSQVEFIASASSVKVYTVALKPATQTLIVSDDV